MKKILILIALASILMTFPAVSNAQAVPEPTQPAIAPITTPEATGFSIHDISGNWTVLANLTNGKFFSAPSIDANIGSAFNGILLLDIKVAFPTNASNGDNAKKSILAGPWPGISITQLLVGHDKIKLAEGVHLKVGAGVLIAVSAIDGLDMRDWKEITFPGGSIGISF
uniref:Uncharacterized protein n=1 Tax=viral metagenome TaxID=1070528 RepID=A0A6M3J9I9_9ZZZZ